MAPMAAMSSGARRHTKPRRRLARAPKTTRRPPAWSCSSMDESRSGGIMEDHANSVPLARIEFADAVAQLHLVVAAPALHRAAVDGEDGRITPPERQDPRTCLHAGALLGHHNLAACKILARLIQEDCDLYRKD